MREIKPSTQLWLGAWEMLQDRSDELFRLLTHDCKRLDLESLHDLRVSSRQTQQVMQELIAQKRQMFFVEFLRQDELCPVTSLGARLRRLL